MAELKIISMDEVQSKQVNWLWYPYIPYGKITIIQGDPGEGKTTLALRLAALLSKGEALPYEDTEREPVRVIYQTAEDGLEDTIKPRLEAAEADCSQINKRATYTTLLTSGKLNSYLANIDEQAEELFSRMVKQIAEREGVTEQLKAGNQLEWVQKMNSIRNRAVKIVNTELIYM